MSFGKPPKQKTPKVEKPVEPVFLAEAASEATDAQRRVRRKGGVVSTFVGGAQGQPAQGTIGKLGLTGTA